MGLRYVLSFDIAPEYWSPILSEVNGVVYAKINNEAYYCAMEVLDESLTTVEFPASIKCVGHYAFWDCTALTNVTFKGEIPPHLAVDAFTVYNSSTHNYEEVIDGLTITVPAGRKSAYTSSSANWLALASIIEEAKVPETGIVADLSLTIGAVVLLGAVLVVLKNKKKEQY